ncbi:MAG: phosphoribosylglycinamide formyltransferase [Bacteroidia bacterium]|nr:phosphoribosylglycinamide formyltransferase [Bacteroidia bacterium]
MKKLAIFASGNGSNAQQIIAYLESHPTLRIGLVVSNKENAGVLEKAEKLGIPTRVLPKPDWVNESIVLDLLKSFEIEGIVLAGFLLKIPAFLVQAFPGRILNIHPALLPKFGGKGMYGMHVHEAVKNSGDRITGITIHEVNEVYDQGKIVFQASCEVLETDTAEAIAGKVQQLEHLHFPGVVASYFAEDKA